jgi:hypothetical protein
MSSQESPARTDWLSGFVLMVGVGVGIGLPLVFVIIRLCS